MSSPAGVPTSTQLVSLVAHKRNRHTNTSSGRQQPPPASPWANRRASGASSADLGAAAPTVHSSWPKAVMSSAASFRHKGRLLPPQRPPSLPDAKKAAISSDDVVFVNKMQTPIFKYLGCLAIHYRKAKTDTLITPLPSLRTPAERNKQATPSQTRQLINSYTATDSNTTNRQLILPPALPSLSNIPTAASADPLIPSRMVLGLHVKCSIDGKAVIKPSLRGRRGTRPHLPLVVVALS